MTNTKHSPLNGKSWIKIKSLAGFDISNEPGSKTPIQIENEPNYKNLWETNTYYNIGDIIKYHTYFYKAIRGGRGLKPCKSTMYIYWLKIEIKNNKIVV